MACSSLGLKVTGRIAVSGRKSLRNIKRDFRFIFVNRRYFRHFNDEIFSGIHCCGIDELVARAVVHRNARSNTRIDWFHRVGTSGGSFANLIVNGSYVTEGHRATRMWTWSFFRGPSSRRISSP